MKLEYLVLFVDPGNVYFDTQSIGNRYGKLGNLGGIVGELGMFIIFCFFSWRSSSSITENVNSLLSLYILLLSKATYELQFTKRFRLSLFLSVCVFPGN